MLALTKRTEYGLIAMCHLARRDGQVVSAREIAEPTRTRVALLMSVLKSLNQKGLLRSTRGASGGYSLARPASEISLADLIDAVEGPVRFVKCVPGFADAGCEMTNTCPVRRPVLKISEHLRQFLAGISIATLAGDESYGSAAKESERFHGSLSLHPMAVMT